MDTKRLILWIFVLMPFLNSNGQCNSSAIFANDSTNAFCFEIEDHVRKCYTNDIPSHEYGPFGGNGAIVAQDFEYSMCRYPELDTETSNLFEDTTSQLCAGGVVFGVSNIGINYSPFARLYFVNPSTSEENLNFHVEADFTLNMDLNGGHVNVLGRYHYHTAPIDYITNDLNVDGNSHSPLLGYAADGFPIYYRYLYTNPLDSTAGVSSFESSYVLKTGNRSGDGISAPNGAFDGTYFEDFEFVGIASDLDECSGRYGVTPEYPEGTYYYVLTDNWPNIPRCHKGKFVDNSFRIGPNCPDSEAATDCSIVPILDLDDHTFSLDYDLYPNPAVNKIIIELADNLQDDVSAIRLYNIHAKTVFKADCFQEEISVEGFPPGTYFIQFNFGNDQLTKKIIIQN